MNSHYPYAEVLKNVPLSLCDCDKEFLILHYQGSATFNPTGITNGIAIIADNMVVIDNIGESHSENKVEQERLFHLASQLSSLTELHHFIHEYGCERRYRGNLD